MVWVYGVTLRLKPIESYILRDHVQVVQFCFFLSFICLISTALEAQEVQGFLELQEPQKVQTLEKTVKLKRKPDFRPQGKGSFYFFWGWNRGFFSNSDIHFEGAGYDFVLKDVVAQDRQSHFAFDPYFKIKRFTYPQTNVQIGYYIKDNLRLSFGVDHMKYVVEQYQIVNIEGEINGTETIYNGNYEDEEIVLAKKFLKFEHTDGLNYYNFELKQGKNVLEWLKLENDIILVEAMTGVGMGFYIPKTNVTLLGGERYDQFNLAGYGVNTVVGLNLTFFKRFFIESQAKAGFVDLPNVRTTPNKADKASHQFWYLQSNVLFGWRFQLRQNSH